HASASSSVLSAIATAAGWLEGVRPSGSSACPNPPSEFRKAATASRTGRASPPEKSRSKRQQSRTRALPARNRAPASTSGVRTGSHRKRASDYGGRRGGFMRRFSTVRDEDEQIHNRIERLVAEEQELYERGAGGG